jgi:hypothetical protein
MEAIKANEINDIIRQQIENFDTSMTVSEVGTVIKVGDGIAEIHGLEKVMAVGFFVKFALQNAFDGFGFQPQRFKFAARRVKNIFRRTEPFKQFSRRARSDLRRHI